MADEKISQLDIITVTSSDSDLLPIVVDTDSVPITKAITVTGLFAGRTFTPSGHASTHMIGGSDAVAYSTPGANRIVAAGVSGVIDPTWLDDAQAYRKNICDGRLTLTSNTPVTMTDVTGATTLYYTPYIGNQILLYIDNKWRMYEFEEESLSLTGYTASGVYDIFIYNNGGNLTLESAAWTNPTTRASALGIQDGIYVKQGDTSRRYLGTIAITGTEGQTEDSFTKRYVWNYYNRVNRVLYKLDTTSHTYNSTVRYFNNDSNNKVEFVIGKAQDAINGVIRGDIYSDGTAVAIVSFGVDTVGYLIGGGVSTKSTAQSSFSDNSYLPVTTDGYHYIAMVEGRTATGTGTFSSCKVTVFIRG